ncbi:MAG: glycosyltransferase family 9 protein [Acidobacteria bacterium]|nr:glycosyltransferase family 9 protein [Acidobacteriota bacterium]
MTPIEEIHHKLSEFEALKEQGSLTAAAALALASRASELVIEHHRNSSGCLREAVNLICRIATDSDGDVARSGITALFPLLVERLNDSFEPTACRLYDELFIQVIQFCRRLPEGHQLDEGLKQFGLMTEFDLLERKAKLPTPDSRLPTALRVLLLSRVTIGADVAVTSAIIARLRQAFPQAEFVILGSRKLRELYGGDDRIRIHEIAYERGGSLIARLTSWLDVVAAVNEERQGFSKDEVWVIDPDSRLTQLGLLPLAQNDENYFFFESRSYQPNTESKSIGQLAANWSGELIGNHEPAYPFVALPKKHQQFGQSVIAGIQNPKSKTPNRIVAVSFGVGGNQTKRVSAEFEQQLIEHLLADSKIILDKGATQEERDQINRIVAIVRAAGKNVVEFDESNNSEFANSELQQASVVTWDGSIGAFAGLIAASDKYIGYDSAGQHIAAALGVPTLTIFVGSNNATFAERWRPFGKSAVEVMKVEPASIGNLPLPASLGKSSLS